MHKNSTIVTAALISLGFAGVANAQIDNGSFESGDFAGWSLTGYGQVLTSSFARTDGSYGAIITTGGNTSDTSIESFLGMSYNALDNLAGPGNATRGTALKQSINASAGSVIEIDWRFVCNDYMPYNDFAGVVIDGIATVLSRVQYCDGLGGGALGFQDATSFATFSHTFTSSGAHTIGFFTVDVRDTVVDSGLIIDNVRFLLGQPEVIMDNHEHDVEPAGVSFTGDWPKAGTASEHFGRDGRYAESGGDRDSYRFTPDLTGPGNYRVMVWNNCFSPRANNVPHTIVHSGGSTTLSVDQDCNTGSHGEWLELGTFQFNAGTAGYLEISDDGLAAGYHIGADGARFVRDDVIVLDNGEPGTSADGEWFDALSATENHGVNSVYAQGGDDIVDRYRFTPNIASAGNYEVSVWNACFSPRDSNVRHTIAHAGGSTTVYVDQDCSTGSHGEWNPLGTFSFDAGSSGFVEISNAGQDEYSYVGADAVLFVPVP
ncbi:MAG: hypothetical protein MJE77_30995 [Proteobacteria bacterium]|nr:hypothetical protein [Pseudomonadota bacterium]